MKEYQDWKIVGVDVFPQGFAAVASRIKDFKGVNMLCDIGNGTMNIMFIKTVNPSPSECSRRNTVRINVCWRHTQNGRRCFP